jgi:hypothetical protein
MIVRIAGEGRWRLSDGRARALLAEDLRLMRAVDDEREADYHYQVLALCRFVRQHGERLPAVARDADVTIPSPQMTLAETIELLSEQPSL